MKRIPLVIAVLVAPWAICQDNNSTLLHQSVDGVLLTAQSIQRDISRVSYNPVVELRGTVEIIKPICVRLTPSATDRQSGLRGDLVCQRYMVLQADEAEYHEDTGEITPRGNVRITFEDKRK